MDKKRDLERKIIDLLKSFPVVAIIGPRQSGKSTLARQLLPDWKYYDLESPSDYYRITSDPLTFFDLNSSHLIIDEAQQYPDLFKVLRTVVDKERNVKGRFVITGSSSPEIVKGLTESLAGRIATVELSNFKINELYEKPLSPVYDLIATSQNIDDFLELQPTAPLRDALKLWYRGGFPEPLIKDDDFFYSHWMENYLANYINRDIRSLFSKLDIHVFRRFLLLLSQFSGHQLNMSEMARSLEVSVMTVKSYLDIIHQTFLWRNLPPFEKNSLKKIQKSTKGFFRDSGILHYMLKINSLDDLYLHPVAGFSFESFAIEELIRGMHATLTTQLEFSYYRTVDKSEIDLVIDGRMGVVPIEIKLGSMMQKRDLFGLNNFIKDMNLPYGIIVNTGPRIEKVSEKIIQIPINYL